MEKIIEKLGLILIIVVLGYLISAFVFSIFPFNLAKKVINTDKIVSNYEWYYDAYSQIKSYDEQIKESEININNYDKSSDLYERKVIELDGMKKVRQNLIAEYNSKSKQITRNLWKSKDLPYQINLKGEY